MSKTIRKISSLSQWYLDKSAIPSKHKNSSEIKIYAPQNHMSKRYKQYCIWTETQYEAGGYCRGHKTRTHDNQRLNHMIRQREKRLIQKEILNELTE